MVVNLITPSKHIQINKQKNQKITTKIFNICSFDVKYSSQQHQKFAD